MSRMLNNNFRFRRTFCKTPPALDVSNLIEIQRRSYLQFLQPDVAPEEREDVHGAFLLVWFWRKIILVVGVPRLWRFGWPSYHGRRRRPVLQSDRGWLHM